MACGIAILFLFLSAVSGPSAQTSNRTEVEKHYERAQAAVRSNQSAVAESEFREILRLDPKNASAHANLGVIAFTERDYPRASEEFRTALKLQPNLWNTKAFLGMSELRQAHQATAQPLLEDSFEHLQDDHLKSQVGMDIISLDYHSADPDRATEVLRTLLRIRPPTPDVLYTAYRAYSDLAARALSNLAETAPDSPQMHQILAQASASQDDFFRCDHAISQGARRRCSASRNPLRTWGDDPRQFASGTRACRSGKGV